MERHFQKGYGRQQYDEKPYNNINIVIPMAGAGSRFFSAGYDLPKPFIEFNGEMMIEHVLSSFNWVNAYFTLVLQEKFLSEQKEQIDVLKNKYNVNIVTVPKLTMGAAITALIDEIIKSICSSAILCDKAEIKE